GPTGRSQLARHLLCRNGRARTPGRCRRRATAAPVMICPGPLRLLAGGFVATAFVILATMPAATAAEPARAATPVAGALAADLQPPAAVLAELTDAGLVGAGEPVAPFSWTLEVKRPMR